jgi:hypothetical protein
MKRSRHQKSSLSDSFATSIYRIRKRRQ